MNRIVASMHKKIGAFSLAEAMIVMLIITMVALVSAPVITKKRRLMSANIAHGKWVCTRDANGDLKSSLLKPDESLGDFEDGCKFPKLPKNVKYLFVETFGGGGGGSRGDAEPWVNKKITVNFNEPVPFTNTYYLNFDTSKLDFDIVKPEYKYGNPDYSGCANCSFFRVDKDGQGPLVTEGYVPNTQYTNSANYGYNTYPYYYKVGYDEGTYEYAQCITLSTDNNSCSYSGQAAGDIDIKQKALADNQACLYNTSGEKPFYRPYKITRPAGTCKRLSGGSHLDKIPAGGQSTGTNGLITLEQWELIDENTGTTYPCPGECPDGEFACELEAKRYYASATFDYSVCESGEYDGCENLGNKSYRYYPDLNLTIYEGENKNYSNTYCIIDDPLDSVFSLYYVLTHQYTFSPNTKYPPFEHLTKEEALNKCNEIKNSTTLAQECVYNENGKININLKAHEVKKIFNLDDMTVSDPWDSYMQGSINLKKDDKITFSLSYIGQQYPEDKSDPKSFKVKTQWHTNQQGQTYNLYKKDGDTYMVLHESGLTATPIATIVGPTAGYLGSKEFVMDEEPPRSFPCSSFYDINDNDYPYRGNLAKQHCHIRGKEPVIVSYKDSIRPVANYVGHELYTFQQIFTHYTGCYGGNGGTNSSILIVNPSGEYEFDVGKGGIGAKGCSYDSSKCIVGATPSTQNNTTYSSATNGGDTYFGPIRAYGGKAAPDSCTSKNGAIAQRPSSYNIYDTTLSLGGDYGIVSFASEPQRNYEPPDSDPNDEIPWGRWNVTNGGNGTSGMIVVSW